MPFSIRLFCITLLAFNAACSSDDSSNSSDDTQALNPDDAPKAAVDRFSAKAGMLMVRTADNQLPGPNEPIDFDSGEPFITRGLSPKGDHVEYYNFDVQPTAPAPIYALFRTGESEPVDGQLNIVDVIPGVPGYNDFWQVNMVTVPVDYVANTVTSVQQIRDGGFDVKSTNMLVNCPIVPAGSTAKLRLTAESAELTHGWYRDQMVYYFNFSEASLTVAAGKVPTSPIYVTFNTNPGATGGGPASGFKTEPGTPQTHNVPSTLPGDPGYSPLWAVHIYDNANWDTVTNLATAAASRVLEPNGPTVNCPIVSVP
jgi:hypothetical protein